MPTGGVPGMPTENPASSPSSAGTNTAQQQLMQQMLQMFAGGAGGNASVHTNLFLLQPLLLNSFVVFGDFSLRPSPRSPRHQRCGSSPSWTSSTPWASSTARPTCRPSSLLEETSTPLSRDFWAHSPRKKKTIQYTLTPRHIHT